MAITNVYAVSNPVTTKVKNVGTYGSGGLFVMTEATLNEPGCELARFDIPSDHPQLKNWLSIAQTALVSQTDVVIRISECLGGRPTIGLTKDGYFYLKH